MRHQDDMAELFDGLEDLTTTQRRAIKERYSFLMSDYRSRCRKYTYLFYAFKLTMTVGSLAVPALLSIQTSNTGAMYWVTWGLSLAVTTANGITTLFKLDKRFFVLHATMERLRTETWQFIELSGRYSGHHGHTSKPTHKNQYVYYCSQIEKIHMKQIDEEFIKNADMDQAHPPAASGSGTGARPLTGGDVVPSPADQAGPGSPPAKPRRESQSTAGSDDTVIEIDSKPNKKKEEVIILKEPTPTETPVQTPDVSESTVRLRTPLQSGQVQQ